MDAICCVDGAVSFGSECEIVNGMEETHVVPSFSAPVGITMLGKSFVSTRRDLGIGAELERNKKLFPNSGSQRIRQLGRVEASGGAWRLARVFFER